MSHSHEFYGYEAGVFEESDKWLVVDRDDTGHAVIAPRWFKARYKAIGGPPLVLTIEIKDDGTPWCRELTIESGVQPGVTTGLLRELPLRRIVREVAWSRREPVAWGDDGSVHLLPATTEGRDRFLEGAPARATHLVTDELLNEVARIYRANPAAPARAVHEQLPLKISRATAGRYIAEARRRGKLGPATPRKAGEAG